MLKRFAALVLVLGVPLGACSSGSETNVVTLKAGETGIAQKGMQILGTGSGGMIERLSKPYKSYRVMLINTSKYTVQRMKVDGGEWVDTYAIGRTCERNNQPSCVKEEKWYPLTAAGCGGDHTLELQMTDANGEWHKTKNPWKFRADCAASAGVFGLAD